MSVIALLPAAGYGARFHERGPKALVPLCGKPLLLHALERLAASERVDRAVVAIAAEFEAAFASALASAPLPVITTPGGVTRRASVTNAFQAAKALPDDLICIHDAARPLVDPAEVAAVVDAALVTGAAIAGFSMIETVKRVGSGRIVETVPRGDLVAAATPQIFRASLLAKALAREVSGDVTDDSELVERAGVPVSVVLTSRWNLKITYPEDLVWAESFLTRTTPSRERTGS